MNYFSYPFVNDEEEYNRIKNNSYYYPFDWDTTYTTTTNNPTLYKAAKDSGFIDVARMKNENDYELWHIQNEFLNNMNYEKLSQFTNMTYSEGHSINYHESFIFHSREFNNIPCLTDIKQINSSFTFEKINEVLYNFQQCILKKYHYQVVFYRISSVDKQYIIWIEAYNPNKLECILDDIKIRNIQKYYTPMFESFEPKITEKEIEKEIEIEIEIEKEIEKEIIENDKIEPKESRRRSLSNYMARNIKFKLKISVENSAESPSLLSPHLTSPSENYQEMLNDLKQVEKQRDLLEKQHELLIQKLTAASKDSRVREGFSLKEKRTKSADYRKDSPQRKILMKGKSASPRKTDL